jgi:ankyrin repeat protein
MPDAIDSKPNGDVHMGAVLLEAGAKLDATDFNGWTPLHRAAHAGYVDFVRLLIEHGAKVDARTQIDELYTPLMEAASAGHAQVVNLLLANGADKELTDIIGCTARMIAERNGHREVAQMTASWNPQSM